MQAKRIVLNVSDQAVPGQGAAQIIVPDEPREMVNLHNIWVGGSLTPLVADANSEGNWVLAVIPAGTTHPQFTDAIIQTEDFNARIVACGQWAASNQTPWVMPPTQFKTSRNLNPGDALSFVINQTTITTGSARFRLIICAHTIRK